jgi:hypothetical protein
MLLNALPLVWVIKVEIRALREDYSPGVRRELYVGEDLHIVCRFAATVVVQFESDHHRQPDVRRHVSLRRLNRDVRALASTIPSRSEQRDEHSGDGDDHPR